VKIPIIIANFTQPKIAAPKLFTPSFNRIGTMNFGMGSGGHITVDTPILTAEDSLIETANIGDGLAGDININAQQIELNNYALIDATTSNFGRAGDITISENDSLFLSNFSSITTSTSGSGAAGNININAQQIKLDYSSRIDASTLGSGQAGRITINENDSLFLSKFSSISTSTSPNSTGQAGDIVLNTKELTLNLGQINSFSQGYGHAGAINITADVVELSNESGIQTQAKNAGGGNIALNISNHLNVTDNSWITGEALGTKSQDSGGNITIGKKLGDSWENARIFTLKNSRLLANAYAGNGGNINIQSNDFIGNNSQIDVSSRLGLNGQFQVNGIEFQENYSLLPDKISLITTLVACPPLSDQLSSRFNLKRHGGLFDLPGQSRSGSLLNFSVNDIFK